MSKSTSFQDGNPFDWPSSFPEFKELETVLGCGICFEYLSTAMMTKCSHNFCSLCIRRYICYKQQCPICLEPVYDSDLRNNRIVDEIIQNFTQSRARLLALMKSDCSSRANTSSDVKSSASESLSGRPVVTNTPEKRASSPDLKAVLCGNKDKQSDENCLRMASASSLVDANYDSDVAVDSNIIPCVSSDKVHTIESHPGKRDTFEDRFNLRDHTASAQEFSSSSSASSCLLSSPPASKLPDFYGTMSTASSFFASSSSSNTFGLLSSPSAETVPCPVCKIDVPSRNINLHLDRCLEIEQRKDVPSKPWRRKPMPKLVYTLLSEKDLRKKLSEVGLPTYGHKQVLVKRHHEFTLMYNAQCDSLNPKSAQEIVDEIIQNDAAKSRTPSRPIQSLPLKIDKQCSEEQVENAQKEYAKQHKTQFSELIAAASKNRRDNSKTSTVSDLPPRQSPVKTVYDDDDFFCFYNRTVSTSASQSSSSLGSNVVPLVSSANENESSIDNDAVGTEEWKAAEVESSSSSSASLELHSDSASNKEVVLSSRKVRRKLDRSTSNKPEEDCATAAVSMESVGSEIPLGSPPAVTRRILRSSAKQKKSSEKSVSNEMNEDFDDVSVDQDADDDDDYEITSFSGRKRKLVKNIQK